MLPLRRRFSTGSYINSYHWEYREAARCSARRLLYLLGAGEPTMVDPNKVQRSVTPFIMPPNATEVLQRVRDSYSALPEGDVLTGPDQAVRAAVNITLKHLSKAG
jgi:hypothetical protein